MGFSEDNGFSAAELEAATIFRPVGCSQCTLGYKGRVGIYEVMPISDEMSRLIMREGTAIELADQARKEGLSDLRRSGLRKVMSGMTSLEEVNRITKD